MLYNQNYQDSQVNNVRSPVIVLISHNPYYNNLTSNNSNLLCNLKQKINEYNIKTVIINVGSNISNFSNMNYSCLVNNNNDYYNINLQNSSNINNVSNNLVTYVSSSLTSSPSYSPTPYPSYNPTFKPTKSPTPSPTNYPTPLPSLKPSLTPTERPSLQPTSRPTKKPTSRPSNQPSQSLKPTEKPTPPPTRWGRCINSFAYDVNANEQFSNLYNTSNAGWVNGPYISNVNDTN
jgi:hypothetical protein